MNKKEYDVIVVGTGAGGSTVAREMAKNGKKVLMLESGGYNKIIGNTLTVALTLQHFGLTRSKEKNTVTFANNFGGLSNLSAGCATPPPKIVFDTVGIDLSKEIEEAKKDMGINKLPDELIGKSNLRLIEAANSAGYNWTKIENFINPQKCKENCSDCMLGCKRDAKWTARVYGNEAIQNGAELKLHTKVTDVLIENGKVIGVEANHLHKKVKYFGKSVILSAGIANIHILRKAGINEAGRGFCCDWLQFVGGVIPNTNSNSANPMTVGTMEHYESDGFVITPVFPNWSMFAVVLYFMGLKNLPKFFKFWDYTGIMVKVRDETLGEIYKGTSFSKPVSKLDKMKLDKGVGIIKQVLKKAGAADESTIVLNPSGAHPSATCRIGEVVNKNLETDIKNLYCCDASVFPSSLGMPVVWTAVSLGKRLSKYLNKQL